MRFAHENFQKLQLKVNKSEKKGIFLLKMRNVAPHNSIIQWPKFWTGQCPILKKRHCFGKKSTWKIT